MMTKSKTPRYTTATELGSVFTKIYEKARERHPEGAIPMALWGTVVDSDLTKTERSRYVQVSQVVPRDFDPGALPAEIAY